MSNTAPPPAAGFSIRQPCKWAGRVDRMEHPREQRFPDAPRMNGLPHRAVRGGVAEMMIRTREPRGARGIRRPSRARRARLSASGFSQRTCLPACGGEKLGAIQLVGGRNVNRVDLFRLDQIIQALSSHLQSGARCANFAARSAFALITATTSPSLARNAPIMCCAAIVLAPAGPHRSFVTNGPPGGPCAAAPQDARTIRAVGQMTVSGSKFPLAS